MDSYALMTFLMLAVGLALVVAEVFIPSGGMIMIAALACLGVSVWCAVRAWWQTEQFIWWWSYIGALVVLLPGVTIGAFYLLPRTEFGQSFLVPPQSPEELMPYAEEEEHLRQMVGKSGKTLTLLNPGGLVNVDRERMHCESEGMMIDPGETVRVLSVKGNRLVVRRVSATEQPSGEEPKPDTNLVQESSLDFDVPQA